MFETTSSFYLAVGLFAAIWLLGMWKSAQYAFPQSSNAQSDHLDISRKALFHLASLFATAGPLHTFLNGFSRMSIQIWVAGFVILYAIWAYWYLRGYRYSDFLFEVDGRVFSKARQIAGAPKFMILPNWIFNNPVLFLIGLAITLTGFVLSAIHWQLSFLSFATYGIIYLFFAWVYNLLDIIKVWNTHLECRNGFTTGKPTQIPLAEIRSVEKSSTAMQKRLRVSTVEIVTEHTSLRFVMKDVDRFIAALAPE